MVDRLALETAAAPAIRRDTGVEGMVEKSGRTSPRPARERSVKHNDSSVLGISDHEQVSGGLVSSTLPPADKTAAFTRVRYLERELFDDSGHLRRGVTPEHADETVTFINHLRRSLGWLEIDVDGRWRWPVESDQRDATPGLASPQRAGRRRRLGSQTRKSECEGSTPRR
jgi:hypothetical protein